MSQRNKTIVKRYRRKPYSRMQTPKAGDRWARRGIFGLGWLFRAKVLRVSRHTVTIARWEHGIYAEAETMSRAKYAKTARHTLDRGASHTLDRGASFYPAKP